MNRLLKSHNLEIRHGDFKNRVGYGDEYSFLWLLQSKVTLELDVVVGRLLDAISTPVSDDIAPFKILWSYVHNATAFHCGLIVRLVN